MWKGHKRGNYQTKSVLRNKHLTSFVSPLVSHSGTVALDSVDLYSAVFTSVVLLRITTSDKSKKNNNNNNKNICTVPQPLQEQFINE